MNSYLATLHQAHLERVARLNRMPPTRRVEKIAPAPRSTPEPEAKEYKPWFRIIGAGAPTIKDIQVVTAEFFGIAESEMRSQRRDMPIARIRQVAMYLAKTMTAKSMPEIGRRFGGRDHTTALHAVRRIASLLETDRELADEVAEIKFRLECL
jgi:hypothetical protein